MKDNNDWIVKVVREIYGDGRVSYDVVERGRIVDISSYSGRCFYANKTILTTPSQKEAEAVKKRFYDKHMSKVVISTSTVCKL